MTLKLFGGRLLVNIIFIPIAVIMSYLNGIDSVAAFFSALLLHEGAHAIAASALGVRVRSLEVMPFGCTAHIESFAVIRGGREIMMAAAGPCCNIIAAAAVLIFADGEVMSPYTEALFKANTTLAAMNLIPALPLDGGRILATVLALAMPPLTATRLTSILGICASSVMIGVGVYMFVNNQPNPTLFLMGGFIMYSAIKYLRSAAFMFMKSTVMKRAEVLKRGTVDLRDIAAHKSRSVSEVLTALDTRKYNIIHVLDDDMHIVHTINESELISGMVKSGTTESIGSIKGN